ncbi:protein-export chaperone SecB [Helicobacter sp. T3_23-1059]
MDKAKRAISQAQPSNAFQIKTIQVGEFKFKQVGKLGKGKSIEIKQGVGAIAEKDKNTYIIQSNIDISFLQGEQEIFYIKSAIVGVIGVESNFNEKFLNNMVAIMYSYLRPLVAQMTVMAKLPPLDLPPLNFENFKVDVKHKDS